MSTGPFTFTTKETKTDMGTLKALMFYLAICAIVTGGIYLVTHSTGLLGLVGTVMALFPILALAVIAIMEK